MTISAVRMQEKGQVTIPLEIRRKLKLRKGDLVTFVETDAGIVIKPAEIVASDALREIGKALRARGITPEELLASAPEGLAAWERLLDSLSFDIVCPSRAEVLEAAKYTALKDAPILATARAGDVDILVTLDQKHLLGKPNLEAYAHTLIRTPGEAYREIIKRK
jgi:AbrB family looped-hinge helix DNA binding protein